VDVGSGGLIEMIDAAGVKQRSAPLDSMYLVALVEKKLCQVCAILASDA